MGGNKYDIAIRLSGKLRTGDKIEARGDLEDIKFEGEGYAIPLPAPDGDLKHKGIFCDGDDYYSFTEAFCEGEDVQIFTRAEDRLTVEYGGEVKLEYWVTELALEEYRVTKADYPEFAQNLQELGLNVSVEPRKEGEKESDSKGKPDK